MRRIVFVAVLLAGPVASSAFQQNRDLRFDVVSVRVNRSGGASGNPRSLPGGRFVMENAPIARLIRVAYPTPASQLVGAPDWVASERYDINARAEGEPPEADVVAMVRQLLADRFKLIAHFEPRDQDVYALVRSGVAGTSLTGLRPATLDCAALVERQPGRSGTLPARPNGAPSCGLMSDGTRLISGGLTVPQFIRNIAPLVGRPVIDRTGLAGYYEFTLEYAARPGNAAGVPDAADDRPSIFTALQEQLGLRLESQRALVDVLVIDRIERPSLD